MQITIAVRLALILCLTQHLAAQQDRIRGAIDNGRVITLKGHVRPQTRTASADLGRVAPSLAMTDLKLMVKLSAVQQAELDTLLEQQRDPASPNFHRWLTPEEFGSRFGLSPDDAGRTAKWLRSQGFTVESVARGGMWIKFSGTAQQAESAFHTEIHRYQTSGETHFANATDPAIPEALSGIVAAIRGLNDFRPKAPRPQAIAPMALNSPHQLAPSDLATIYDINPLYYRSIDGTGQTLGILGQTKLVLSDLRNFRQAFGLQQNDPQVLLTGPDPGVTGDLIEANLDIEWSGAIAPKAKVVYVYSTDVINSAEYAVDQNVAPVLSMSYHVCESAALDIAASYRTTAQQANAQGITWVVSSGDSGAADCDTAGNIASVGLNVNLLASPPEITAVGGTEFDDRAGNYWSTPVAGGTGAALSYIPEAAWNETTGNNGLIGTGGGVSKVFTKPAWQSGPGVPNDGMRDVPDVALSAAVYSNAYLVEYQGSLIPVGGTSAGTPTLAAILTLLNHYLVANQILPQAGLGNINPNLYRLAQSAPLAFHDITQGNNMMPCVIGSYDCTTGFMGYQANPGYDLATGLGSLDVNYFATHWSDTGGGISMTLTSSASAINQSDSAVLTATVTAPGGITPNGSITFNGASSPLGSAPLIVNGNSGTATLTVYGGQLAVGKNVIRAIYSGSNTLDSAAASTAITVAIPINNSDVVPSIPSVVRELRQPESHGWLWTFPIELKELAGFPTTVTDLTINGVSQASSLNTIFSDTNIPAKGIIHGRFGLAALNVPQSVVIGISGVDGGGFKWTQQVSVLFTDPPVTSSMKLTAIPITSSDPACPWAQQLTLQEYTGIRVHLTRFAAGPEDLTPEMQLVFGTMRLGGAGQLQGTFCRAGAAAPPNETLEVDGTDGAGNTVSATANAVYGNPPPGSPQLTVAPATISLLTSARPGVASTAINIDPGGPNQKWTVSVFPANGTTQWLTVNPTSGTGPGEVLVYGSSDGLSNGTVFGNLVFQSAGATPQTAEVPVALSVGGLNFATISGAGNGASFTQSFAPGMVMSIFGARLAPSTSQARSTPLPTTLNGVSATVNGVRAPIYYTSPSQINIQIPYETSSGTAVVGIDNNSEVATYFFKVTAAAPGIFTGKNNALAPASTAKAGDTITLYMTGDGDTDIYLLNGTSPGSGIPLNSLPSPRLPVTVTVGGSPANIVFLGITPGLVGETQVNFTVPSDVAPGAQPVVVTVGGYASAPVNLTITQ